MDGDSATVLIEERPAPTAESDGTRVAQDAAIGPDAGIMSILSSTRAMRHLAPEPVPEELIRTVIEAATWAPSAANAQLAQFVVVTDRATMARLAVLWRRVIDDYRRLMAAAGVGSGRHPSDARITASVDYQRDHFAETPALIVVCQDMSALGTGTRSSSAAFRSLVREQGLRRAVGLARAWRHAARRSEGASFYPAVQNLLLASRAHGLAACLTTWHLFAEDEFKQVLGIPRDVKTWAVIPIGWPLRRFGPVRRRPVDEVVHRERW